MGFVKFQSDAQRARFIVLQDDLQYRQRVFNDIAKPLDEALTRSNQALLGAVSEIGVPKDRSFRLGPDGISFADEGEVWDAKVKAFVKAPSPAPLVLPPIVKASRSKKIAMGQRPA